MGKNTNKEPISRVDGYAKVTGTARYFAEFEAPNMTYAVMVSSEIAKGTISSIAVKDAEKAPGVLAVYTHLNTPDIPGPIPNVNNGPQTPALGGEQYKILGTDKILFDGQPIALVVADTLERAQYAASLVKATYQKTAVNTDLEANQTKGKKQENSPRFADYKRGEGRSPQSAAVVIEATYTIPVEVHHPMELHGIMAVWEGNDKVTVYAKTQGVKSTQRAIANAFKIEEKDVTVISEFVGGAFGMALRTWPQEIITVAAARKLGRPVKMMMTREQMSKLAGHRPYTIQQIAMGADKDGKLVSIHHEAIAETATFEDFTEGTVSMTRFMYACPDVTTKYSVVPLDRSVPIWMRGPGEATGAFALESAMDEMSHKLGIDPIEFRIRNYTETDPERNLPFSSNYLKEAYKMGSEKIGWYKRNQEPGKTLDNGWLVGYGISTGVFGAHRSVATASAVLKDDGTILIRSAASDIGPGTGTAMVQIASEVLGIPRDNITFELGHSGYPKAPMQGGSSTVSTVGSAVYDVCTEVKQKLAKLAIDHGGKAFKDSKMEDLQFNDGFITNKGAKSGKLAIDELMKTAQVPTIEETKESKGGEEQKKYSMYSFSIHFAEVRVHPKTGVVRVKNVVTVADSGKIVSPKTAASQMIGGVTGGIGMALTEELVIDHRYGRVISNALADYHVPVSADVPHIETLFIDKPDLHTNPMGSKGMGEIALIGFAAAVANAVYNATGKRVRSLPITPDKLI